MTLDQLSAFVAVAELGSFSRAATALHKVQSAVSYNIKSLEEELDVKLFTRSTRKVALTAEGTVLLEEARSVLNNVTQLTAIAAQFGRGIEAGVRVAIDVVFPRQVFAAIAVDFRRRFPGVHLAVWGAQLGSLYRDLADGRVDLGVTGMPDVPRGMVGLVVGAAPMVAVVAPSHPLAAHRGVVPTAVLEQHLQLVVADQSSHSADRDFHVLSPRTWRLADFSLRHEMLLAGVGWGRMPFGSVERDLQEKRLVAIQPEVWAERTPSVDMRVVYRADTPPGPAATWLTKELVARGRAWEERIRADIACG